MSNQHKYNKPLILPHTTAKYHLPSLSSPQWERRKMKASLTAAQLPPYQKTALKGVLNITNTIRSRGFKVNWTGPTLSLGWQFIGEDFTEGFVHLIKMKAQFVSNEIQMLSCYLSDDFYFLLPHLFFVSFFSLPISKRVTAELQGTNWIYACFWWMFLSLVPQETRAGKARSKCKGQFLTMVFFVQNQDSAQEIKPDINLLGKQNSKYFPIISFRFTFFSFLYKIISYADLYQTPMVMQSTHDGNGIYQAP